MSTPKDILYIIPRPEIGGAERQLLMLMQGLDRNRFSPHVICLDGSGRLLPAYREAAETVYVVNRRHSLDIRAFVDLVQHIRQIRPALVHTWLYIANLYGGWAARLAGVPFVVVAQRGLGIDPQHSRFKVWEMKVFNWFIAQFADVLLVNAEAVVHPMGQVGFRPEQTQIIHNGLNVHFQISQARQNALRRELGIRKDEILLGTVSKLDPKKDLKTMAQAFSRVAVRYPNVRLLVIGGGYPSYQEEFEALARDLGIHDRINLLGFRNDPHVVLSLCDISLLSSVTEGLPNAILESMALGKPVVATAVGGVPELIQNGVQGFLVASKDPEAFADRTLDLLDQPVRAKQMGEAGQLRAREYFSAEAMIRKTEAVYTEHLLLEKPAQSVPVPENPMLTSTCPTAV